jgi:hypothetical protein
VNVLPRVLCTALLLAVAACRQTDPPGPASSDMALDPRLAGFLEQVIKDPATLAKEKQDYATRKIPFEQFIFAVFTRKVKFDTTPDNSLALSQLGEYLERTRPALEPSLEDEMVRFLANESHQTMMRKLFLQTVHGLSAPH